MTPRFRPRPDAALPGAWAGTVAGAFLGAFVLTTAAPESQAQSPSVALAPSTASLYDRLGGMPAIEALVDVLVVRLKNDPRTRVAFAENDPTRMRERLGKQFCELTGGPCTTVNPDMRKVHAAIDVTPDDFRTFVALIEESMAETGVPAALRPQVLDRFAPMEREIVNAR